jgi:hypothetical protein
MFVEVVFNELAAKNTQRPDGRGRK